jgi:hypothetical protein
MAWLDGKIVKEKKAVGEWAAAQTLNRLRKEEKYFACVLLAAPCSGLEPDIESQGLGLWRYIWIWTEWRCVSRSFRRYYSLTIY